MTRSTGRVTNDKVEPGVGGHQGEKNFFAVLDVSEHLEAKNKKNIEWKMITSDTTHPPLNGKFHSFFIDFFLPLPLLAWSNTSHVQHT